MARGDLVPDEVTVAMIESRLARARRRGGLRARRLPAQPRAGARRSTRCSAASAAVLDAILFFAISDEVGMERALSRAALEGRADDTREVIAHRLEIYHRETEPIVEHYRMTGKLIPLHADRSIEQVWSEISDALQQVVPA